MAARTRTRTAVSKYHLNGDSGTAIRTTVQETMTEERSPGPCNMSHGKTTLYTGPWASRPGESYSLSNISFMEDNLAFLASTEADLYQQVAGRLNRNKLYSTNKFGTLQLIAEIDDTVALFTKRFWKQLSYGSFTWGVLPFISEVKALHKYLKNASKSFDADQKYVDENIIAKVYNGIPGHSNGVFTVGMQVSHRLSGRVKFDLSDNLSEFNRFMDRLGLHPDINVAWDLIPLSFVVDWFLPIGDYISNLYESGWVRQVNFEGWETVKVEHEAVLTGRIDSGWTPAIGASSSGIRFSRRYVSIPLELKPEISESKVVKPKNIADTMYLMLKRAGHLGRF